MSLLNSVWYKVGSERGAESQLLPAAFGAPSPAAASHHRCPRPPAPKPWLLSHRPTPRAWYLQFGLKHVELALQLSVLGPQGPPVFLQSLVLAPPLLTLLLGQSQGPLREMKGEGAGTSGLPCVVPLAPSTTRSGAYPATPVTCVLCS